MVLSLPRNVFSGVERERERETETETERQTERERCVLRSGERERGFRSLNPFKDKLLSFKLGCNIGHNTSLGCVTATHQHQKDQGYIKMLSYNYTLHNLVVWGLSLAMTSSLHSNMHLPETEINSPKTACSCPRDGVIKQIRNSHTANPLTPQNAFVKV